MKQVDVAIECTVDYQHEGSNFVPQIDAGGGRIDLFRLVTYREDGYVVPLKNAPVSANPAVLTRYIEAHSELNEISYSDMCSTALAKLRSNKENNRNAAAPESIRFDSISVKDTKTEWPEAGTLDYGRFPGLLRGYNLEYMNCSTGDVTYAPCIYVENTVESYVNRRMDAGIDLFAAYREKDYLPTGRAVFRGYVTEYYDPVERETLRLGRIRRDTA